MTVSRKMSIIDDTVEIKQEKYIQGSCRNIWSNKDKRAVKGLNIVSLNYSDTHTDMMLDFSVNYNKNQIIDSIDTDFHHRSNAYKRRVEENNGKNIQALEMLKRTLNSGIYADYLLVDSWYAKPNFINEVKSNGLDVIARVPKSNKIWQFVGKYKTLESLYGHANKTKASKLSNYNSIKYSYSTFTLKNSLVLYAKVELSIL